MVKKVFTYTSIILMCLLMGWGCSSESDDPDNAPGTINVSEDRAIEIAKQVYQLDIVTTAEIRALNRQEWEKTPKEAKGYTPVYHIISGKKGSTNVTVYVSTYDENHRFVILEEEVK
ncbi:hypothetical protein FOI68_22510 [Brevibacillus sp. LEMMJ03]|uniref:hypothetical protein n=1 Tax=Brevibacillus sp. LEMMJ03 TaxID=2595056 RepID=UPI00117D7EEA|nr:hypothetical protein [Brevibacillus sp. LEMMJ03]TRY22488.1 hypothetical protein FOI68_22510 [Brevibacillus sp. LEMMJ03]